MSFIVIANIGANKVPAIGFIPTLQLEEQEASKVTFFSPACFSDDFAQETYEKALEIAKREAEREISQRYPIGTKYVIEAEQP